MKRLIEQVNRELADFESIYTSPLAYRVWCDALDAVNNYLVSEILKETR